MNSQDVAQLQDVDPVEAQRTLVLTPHPLQRVGAYALARLAKVTAVEDVTPERFDSAVARMTKDAVEASRHMSTKEEGAFWLKASGSFFPNSKMNHPSRGKKPRAQVEDEVTAWRRMPAREEWPGCPCALCGRWACGFYGKSDVPLAASVSYRNTTPPTHEGLALCFACLCSFYALPYGCQLSGGPSAAVHSWDEKFLQKATARQFQATLKQGVLGPPPTPRGSHGREITALTYLREYSQRVDSDVELLVFSNHNQEQSLQMHALVQPLAEWLRQTMTEPALRSGFRRLLWAHRTAQQSGSARLAYHAFQQPQRILSTAVGHLRELSEQVWPLPDTAVALVELCFSYMTQVMQVNDKNVEQLTKLARKVADYVGRTSDKGPFQNFRIRHRKNELAPWFRVQGTHWLLANGGQEQPQASASEPLITTGQWRLLFDPSEDQRWAHRQLLYIAVLEELHRRGWRPEKADQHTDDIDESTTADEELAAEEEQ